MKKSKILTICSLLLVMSASIFAVACKGEDNAQSPVTPTITMPQKELLLDKKEITILLGESDYILVEKVGMDASAEVTFQSLDETVATVDEIGVIQAVNVGTTSISVKADGVEETCKITVTLGKYLPELTLKQIEGAGATIGVDGALYFEPVVVFNHQEYTDATYTYDVEDETLGSVKDGSFTASGEVGSTKVTVYASWRGLSGQETVTLQKTVTITVAVPVIELYTRASFEGKAYDTSADILTKIETGATDVQVSVTDGEEIISIDGTEITANTYGKANLLVTYKNASAKTVEKRFDVIVERPVAKYNESFNFAIADGILPVVELWDNETEITEAYFGTPTAKGETVTLVEGKVTAGVALQSNISERKTFTLLTETEGYTVNLCIYTNLIDEVEELLEFTLTASDLTGAYLVTKDLDASAVEAGEHAYIVETYTNDKGEDAKRLRLDYKFKGTFDGGGHTITANVSYGGFFSALENATVTNTNFILNVTGSTKGIGYNPTGLAHQADNSTVSNVYVQLNPAEGLESASSRTWSLSLISNASAYVKLENVVVINNDDFTSLKANTTSHWVAGALFYADAGRKSASVRDEYTKNVFVVAPEKLGNGYYIPLAGGTAQQTFARNDEAGKADAESKTEKGQFAYANALRYESIQALCAGADLSVLPEHVVRMFISDGVTVEVNGEAVPNGAEIEKGAWADVRLRIGNTLLTDVVLQSSNESVAVVADSKVKVDNFGVATVTATGKALGFEITVKFSVTVRVEACETAQLFSGVDGTVDMKAVFGTEKELANAYGVDGMQYTVVNGKITDLTNTTNAPLYKTLILETTTQDYKKVTFTVYTKLLDEASDLSVFNLKDKNVTGCYLVTKDLDASAISAELHEDFTNANTGGGANKGFGYKFTGVFDGNGHTVTVNVKNNGLFGIMENATVTNTRFIFHISGTTSNYGYNPTALAYEANNSTVSNVYAELNPATGLTSADSRTWALSLISKASKELKTENVVVVNNDDFANLKANTTSHWVAGALFYVDAGRNSGVRDNYMQNVFVIAPEKLGNGYYVAMSGGTAQQTFASNDEAGKADAGSKTGATQYTYGNVKRYASVQAFVDSKAWEGVIPSFIMDAIQAD